MESPFETIESAHQYIALLREQIQDVKTGIVEDMTEAESSHATRRIDALRLVDYKLTQLEEHLATSSRLLNDLRALRRLLLRD